MKLALEHFLQEGSSILSAVRGIAFPHMRICFRISIKLRFIH